MRRSEMPASAAQRHRQEIELKGQRLAVEIAAGKDFVAEDQRVVGGGVQLDARRPGAASASASRTAP